MEKLKKIVAKNITEERMKSGLTQLQLAQMLNYSDKAVSKWERGESLPDVCVLKRLSQIFCVSVDYMLCEHSAEDAKAKENAKDKADTDSADAVSPKSKGRTSKRKNIYIGIILTGILALALCVFAVCSVMGYDSSYLMLMCFLPVSLVTLLVFNSIWRGGEHNTIIIFFLIAGILNALYVGFEKYSPWQLFLLLIPAAMILFLCSRLKK